MKDKPNKGFFKELQKKQKVEKKSQPFTWDKPVAEQAKIQDMDVSKRMKQNKSVDKSKYNLVDEQKQFLVDRRKRMGVR